MLVEQYNVEVEPDELAQEIRRYLVNYPGDSEWAEVNGSLLAGHCYVASEAYYHLSGREDELTPTQMTVEVKHESFDGEVSHWFLVDDDNTVIDLTAEQFIEDKWGHTFDLEIDYSSGRGRGFVPPSPSMGAATIVDTINGEL